MLKTEARYVAGRKMAPSNESVFIELLSRLLACASRLCAPAISRLSFDSFCAMILYNCPCQFVLPEEKGKGCRAYRLSLDSQSLQRRMRIILHAHKLEGEYELDGEVLEIANRCVTFLKSDCEYEWRESNFMSTGWVRSALTTLNLVRSFPTVRESLAHHLDQPEGDAAVWPFFHAADFTVLIRSVERKQGE